MTKYHQQAQATNKRRRSWKANIKQDDRGIFTLKPVKTEKRHARTHKEEKTS